MARIRTIKPEFPQSESIGRLSRDARLLFIQLFTVCDDAGRCRAASRLLASLLYPYDDDAGCLIDGWLDELEREGCLRRYEADNTKYLEISNWNKHQKIDKPTASKLPGFVESSRAFAKPLESSATDLGPVPVPRTVDLGPKSKTSLPSKAMETDRKPRTGSGKGFDEKDLKDPAKCLAHARQAGIDIGEHHNRVNCLAASLESQAKGNSPGAYFNTLVKKAARDGWTVSDQYHESAKQWLRAFEQPPQVKRAGTSAADDDGSIGATMGALTASMGANP